MDQKQIKSKVAEGYIYSRIILEVVGKPKEYVQESLKEYLKKIKADKSYLLIKEKTEKPEEQDGFFSAFSEIEILFKNSLSLLSFCFDYMPSSLEIIEPEKTILKNNDFTGFINDMLSRSHTLNTTAIQMQDSNRFFIKNTAVLLRNFIIVLLSSKPMALKQLHSFMGVREQDIEKVLEVLIKEKKAKKEGELYSVVVKKDGKN